MNNYIYLLRDKTIEILATNDIVITAELSTPMSKLKPHVKTLFLKKSLI